MKANEFVKSTNIENVKFILEGVESEYIEISAQVDGIYMFDTVSVCELKRLVEAHELVEKAGGFDESKDILGNVKPWSAGYNILSNTYFSGDIFSIDQEFYISDLFEAIKLVESCQ